MCFATDHVTRQARDSGHCVGDLADVGASPRVVEGQLRKYFGHPCDEPDCVGLARFGPGCGTVREAAGERERRPSILAPGAESPKEVAESSRVGVR